MKEEVFFLRHAAAQLMCESVKAYLIEPSGVIFRELKM